MDSALTIAASGMGTAIARFTAAASNLANMALDGPVPPAAPSQPLPAAPFAIAQGPLARPNLDMADQVVSVIEARAAFGASVAAFKAARGMTQKLFDLMA